MNKRNTLLTLSLISSLLFFSCDNTNVNNSSSMNQENEVLSVAKNTISNYKDVNTAHITSNNFNLGLNAKYTQTKNVYEYEISFKDASLDIESENIKDKDNLKLYMDLTGSYLTKDVEYYNKVIDEENSKTISLDFDHELVYYASDIAYFNLSSKINKKIYDDETISSNLRFKKESIKDLITSNVKNISNQIKFFDSSYLFNPYELLDEIISSNLVKNYVTYNKVDALYNVSLELNSVQISSLLGEYLPAYSSDITVNQNSTFKFNIYFTSEELTKVSVDSNVNVLLNFGSMGKVDFSYVTNGILSYSNTLNSIDSFDTSNYESYESKEDRIQSFTSDIYNNLKTIYKEIITFFN